jgi:hypothetical protein
VRSRKTGVFGKTLRLFVGNGLAGPLALDGGTAPLTLAFDGVVAVVEKQLTWAGSLPAWTVGGTVCVPLTLSMVQTATPAFMNLGTWPGRAGTSSMPEYVLVRSSRGDWYVSAGGVGSLEELRTEPLLSSDHVALSTSYQKTVM